MNNSRISSPTIQGTAICHAGMVKEEAGQPVREMTECSIWRPLSRFTQLSATTHDYKSLHVIAICTECKRSSSAVKTAGMHCADTGG